MIPTTYSAPTQLAGTLKAFLATGIAQEVNPAIAGDLTTAVRIFEGSEHWDPRVHSAVEKIAGFCDAPDIPDEARAANVGDFYSARRDAIARDRTNASHLQTS